MKPTPAKLQRHPIGEAFVAPFDIVLSQHDVVEPDLLVVLSDQSGIVIASARPGRAGSGDRGPRAGHPSA
jgi:hypothetical protein